MFKEKRELRIPGPTPVPPRAVRALEIPMIGHRTADFSAILERVTERLKRLVGTDQDVYITSSSGTGAMEAAVANTVNRGDKTITVAAGKFGERWGELCSAFGAQNDEIKVENGQAVDPAEIEKRLKAAPETKVVCITQNETSTGVQMDVAAIAGIVAKTDAILIVDAVSSLGGTEFRMDEWGVDIIAAGSQKALMLPPGLGVIALSEKAWKAVEACQSPRYYFDLKACRKNMGNSTTPFTPPVNMYYALDETTAMLEEEGLEKVYQRHIDMKNMVRAAASAIGLPLFAADDVASNTITAIAGDGTFDVEKFRKLLGKKYRVDVAGGQSELKGTIFRIGHMGYMDRQDMVATIASVEMALVESGYKSQLGAGVKAAMEVMLKCEF